MNKKAVLVFGAGEKTLHDLINAIINHSEWNIVSTSVAEEAIEKFHQQDFDIAVFTNGFHEEEKKLRRIFTLQNPDVAIIQNDDADLLLNEIKEAVIKKQKPGKRTFSFVDDALKNAMLPITVQ